MDVNLTYGIPLKLNVTLLTPPSSESFWASTLGIALIVVIGALAGALIAGSVQFLLELKKDNEKKIDNQIRAQNNLQGSKCKVPSYYSIFLQYRINEASLLLRSKIKAINILCLQDRQYKGKTKTKMKQMIISEQDKHPDYHEAMRVRGKAEEFLILIPKVSEDFGSLISQIEILFRGIDVARGIAPRVTNIDVAEKKIDDIEIDIKETFKKLQKTQDEYLDSLNPNDLDEFIKKINELETNRLAETGRLFKETMDAQEKFESEIEALWKYLDTFRDC